MNTMRAKSLIIGATCTAALTLSGCSSMETPTKYVMDSQKIFQVQQAAKTSANHVDIIWVNPPQKRVEKK